MKRKKLRNATLLFLGLTFVLLIISGLLWLLHRGAFKVFLYFDIFSFGLFLIFFVLYVLRRG